MNQIKTNKGFLNALDRRFNKGKNSIHAFDRENEPGHVIISAEHDDDINNWPVGDYYDATMFDPEEKNHIFGINRVLHKWCEDHGWGLEWENGGTIIAYKN